MEFVFKCEDRTIKNKLKIINDVVLEKVKKSW